MRGTVTTIAEIPIANQQPLRLLVECDERGKVKAEIVDPEAKEKVQCVLKNFQSEVNLSHLPQIQSSFANLWAKKSPNSPEVSVFPRLRGGGCGSSTSSTASQPQTNPSSQSVSRPAVGSQQPAGNSAQRPQQNMATVPVCTLALTQLDSYELQKSDYFTDYMPSNTTILNSHVAALKRCVELTRGVAVFNDPDFGPGRGGGATSIYYSGNPPNANYPDTRTIKWQRPSEIIKNTCFFSNDISSNDSVQGNLGDCWFIGALSVLATRDELIRGSIECLDAPGKITTENAGGLNTGVYPPLFHPFAKKGLYCFSFFKNAKWRYVIIDDKVPFQVDNNTFVFGHCRDSRELWVSLIEKAYAKLHTCYEALISGLVSDGLVDMTGFACDTFKLQGKGSELVGQEDQLEKIITAFWDKMKQASGGGCLMGCSIDTGGTEESVTIDQQPSGLLSGHAYSISSFLYIDHPEAQKRKKRHRLLVLRNPWGEAQWNAKWGQRSAELSDNLQLINKNIATQMEAEERFDPTDTTTGAFLMCYKDWRSVYTTLFVCVDFPSNWSGLRFKGSWTESTSGGLPMTGPESQISWAKNPQYILDLQTPTEVFIMLFQEDGRLVPNLPYPFKGFIKNICVSLMRLEKTEEGLDKFDAGRLIKNAPIRDYRDTNIDKITLNPGRYMIVPSTKEPGQTANYFLSVYYSCPKSAFRMRLKGTEYMGEPIVEEEETSTKATPAQVKSLQQMVSRFLSQ